jgi:hypothetical protein
MKTRRWMKTLLEEAKKTERIKPVWSRDIRPKRGMARAAKATAAE